jgi:hypothetical protein
MFPQEQHLCRALPEDDRMSKPLVGHFSVTWACCSVLLTYCLLTTVHPLPLETKEYSQTRIEEEQPEANATDRTVAALLDRLIG